MSNWRFSDELGVERELSTSELRTALSSGSLLPSTLVWREGMAEWQPAFTMPELATAAIAAARGPRSPSVPPPGPPKKRGPLKTLLGVASPLVPDSDPRVAPPRPPSPTATSGAIVVPAPTTDARPSPQTQPIGGSLGGDVGIPRAPRIPRESQDPGPSEGENTGSRTRSNPPPLPGSVRQTNKLPRRLPTPAPFVQPPSSQRRATLMGIPKPPVNEESTVTVTQSELIEASKTGAAPSNPPRGVPSRPPPPLPPKRSNAPPPLAETPTAAPRASTPPPGEVTGKSKPKPPSPPRRSIPPGVVSAPTPTPAPVEANPRAPRIAPPRRNKTLEMDAVLEEKAASPAAEAKTQAEPPKATKPSSGAAAKEETTEQIQRPQLLGAKELLATLGDEEDDNTLVRKSRAESSASENDSSSPEPSSRRAKTLEMTLADHAEAAETKPVPDEPEAKSEPAPRSLTDKIPPPARLPKTDVDGAETSKSSSPAPSRTSRPRVQQAVQVPRRSIVGVSLLWMVGLVTFFFVGRCSGIQRASEIVDARQGLTKAMLRALPRGPALAGAQSSEPKPCWVSRQPARWAKEASKNVPFDSEPVGATMALGYAVGDKEGVGIVIDPKTGKFEEKLRKKVDDPLARVAPMSSADGGFYLATKGDKDVLPVNAASPFYLVFDKDTVGHADAPDAAPAEIFHVDGEGDISAPQVLDVRAPDGPDTRFFLAFRRGARVYGGTFAATFSPVAPLAAIPGSGGKIGKPKVGYNGTEVAIAFADMPEGEKNWQVRLGHAKAGSVPDSTTVVELPEGGPGGDKISPDIVGLDDGRWILMWTEGASGQRAIRAITLTPDFKPIGDPIALSPPAGDFGQASLGVVGTYTTVVFLQRGDDSFEMWGAVLQCG